jgi:transposase
MCETGTPTEFRWNEEDALPSRRYRARWGARPKGRAVMRDIAVETIGCDVSDKKSELFILGPDGQTVRPEPIKTTREAYRDFFQRRRAHVVIEVGQHSRWISDLLAKLGHQVTVANPRRVKLISDSDSKTDRTDAELLARLGKADVKLLAPIQHRGEEAQADLAVAKARSALVVCRTKLVNHARSVVKSFGERLPKCTSESFHLKAWPQVPEKLRPALKPVFGALQQLHLEIRTEDHTLARVAKRYPEVELLSQPDGVGLLTALVYLLTLEDKNRFKKSRMAGAFIGLRPKKDQSGNTDKQLRITKAGDPFLRRLLVGSANYILGPFGKESDLRRWGLQLASGGGKNATKRAKVALARKLAVLMHRLWVTGEPYQPVGYSKHLAA